MGLGTRILKAVLRSPLQYPQAACPMPVAGAVCNGKKTSHHDGAAGRHAAPYLHHLPCACREKDCQPIASASCARLVTARRGGFPQKQAGQDFVRFPHGSSSTDRRRLLSTIWAPKQASQLAPRQSWQGAPSRRPVERGSHS
jgi:hypothetical protein